MRKHFECSITLKLTDVEEIRAGGEEKQKKHRQGYMIMIRNIKIVITYTMALFIVIAFNMSAISIENDLHLEMKQMPDFNKETEVDCPGRCSGNTNKEKCREFCDRADAGNRYSRKLTKREKPENMELIEAGSFLMGCVEDCDISEAISAWKVRVFITNDFYIDKFEVTQKDFADVMGYNPAYYQGDKCSDECPVESITWDEANSYCNAVGKRLPTAAEWEYAARGGTTTRHYWGNDVNNRYLWYKNNSGKRPKPVGGKLPNEYGLYDMEGNVFEYVQDCDSVYTNYITLNESQNYVDDSVRVKILIDPSLAEDNCEKRLIKGSSFAYEGRKAASYYSYYQDADERRGDRGFRCVMDVHGEN